MFLLGLATGIKCDILIKIVAFHGLTMNIE